jgi:hypothetical protein
MWWKEIMAYYKIPLKSDQLTNLIKLVDIEVLKADISLNVDMEDYWRAVRKELLDAEYFDPIAENDE